MSQTQLKQQAIQAPAWNNLTMNSPWGKLAGVWTPIQYYMDANGTVHLRGTVTPSTSFSFPSTIAVLPSGYRPAYTYLFVALGNDAFAEIRIDSSGNISVTNGSSTASGSWYTFDNISFDTRT